MEQLIFPTTKKAAERTGKQHSNEENKNALFPSQLRALRKEKGISQADLAKELGISKSTLGLWETGDTLPDAKSVRDLAVYFGVSADYLLGIPWTPDELEKERICTYTHLTSDVISNIRKLCGYKSDEIALNFILKDDAFLANIIDYLTSSMWDDESIRGKILTWLPPSQDQLKQAESRRHMGGMISCTPPIGGPLFAPDAEITESICFAQIIKELTEMRLGFELNYMYSTDFLNELVRSFVDQNTSTT